MSRKSYDYKSHIIRIICENIRRTSKAAWYGDK